MTSVQSNKYILEQGGRGLQERSIWKPNRAARIFITYKICKMYWETLDRSIDILGEHKAKFIGTKQMNKTNLLILRQNNLYEKGMGIIGCYLAQQWTVFHCQSDINSDYWFNQQLWYNYIERIRGREVGSRVRFTTMMKSTQCLRFPGKHILCRKFIEEYPWSPHWWRTKGNRIG